MRTESTLKPFNLWIVAAWIVLAGATPARAALAAKATGTGVTASGATASGTTAFAEAVEAVESTQAGPLHLSLTEAVELALAANPGLEALAHNAMAETHAASAAARSRWGELDVVGSYSQLNDDQIVRPISTQLLGDGFEGLPFDDQQLHYGASWEIPLYLGGRITAQTRIARLEAQRASELLAGSRWQVQFNTVSLYAAAQGLDAVITAFEDQVRALEESENRMSLMVAEGKLADIDRLKVVEELEDARAQHAAAVADRIRVGALLLAVLGRDPQGGIEVDPPADRIPELLESKSMLRTHLDSTSVVRRAELATQQADGGVKVARSRYIPRVGTQGSYLRHDAPSLDETLDTWAVSVGVVAPIFTGGARGAQMAAARERRQAADQRLTSARLGQQAQLERALAAYRSAQSEVTAARSRVDAGSEAARIEQIRYDNGASTIEDLLRAISREQGARAAEARAVAKAWTAAQGINSVVEMEVVR